MLVEYIWLDADYKFRSKIRVCDEITDWNYDGSSTGQATTESSEVILKPHTVFKNPLLDGDSYLVVCSTYNNDKPLITNHRHLANEIFNQKLDEEPWFGLEQEYFLYKNNEPLKTYTNKRSNEYYCNPIAQHELGIKIIYEHLFTCIKAGIKISGINAEVSEGQWEFQIGPCVGIETGDHLLAARYLLEVIAAKYYISINYKPKPILNVNGSGCHANFSTKSMREPNGYNKIIEAIEKLSLNHEYHMTKYGEDNKKRMTGYNETASYDVFTYGIGSRNTSVRIGNETFKNKCGYFEDRRPAANIDPYMVTSLLFQTCIL
jgi:glutamine synthetase